MEHFSTFKVQLYMYVHIILICALTPFPCEFVVYGQVKYDFKISSYSFSIIPKIVL